MKTLILSILLISSCIVNGHAQTSKDHLMNTPKASGYASVNGLKLYYEVFGEGKPIVLLHGSYMNIDMN